MTDEELKRFAETIRNAREREAGRNEVGSVTINLAMADALLSAATVADATQEQAYEIRRLRELIKKTEDLVDGCPWCHRAISHSEGMGHKDSCPAFTPCGELR